MNSLQDCAHWFGINSYELESRGH